MVGFDEFLREADLLNDVTDTLKITLGENLVDDLESLECRGLGRISCHEDILYIYS